ncbi:MAG: DUF433 domain-containing protein [Chloroflexi bacterium]|nr:DUF433 domain-containing protein [Chloroflexota bacterium]
MSTIESINLIYRDPDVRGGRPCIVGTDLRVLDIVISKIFSERTPDQLAEDYALSMAEVYAALAYYHCNKAEIDEDIRDDFKRSDELARQGLSPIERPVYEDVNPERDLAAIKSATVAQAVATALETHAEAIAKQVLEPLEQEVE